MRKIIISISLGLVTLLTGCASVNSPRKDTTIESIPAQAHLKIDRIYKDFDDKQQIEEIQSGKSPQEIKFERCSSYKVTAEHNNVKKEFVISQSINPAVFGNLIFGGVIGAVVDGATGNACEAKERYIVNLEDGTLKNNESLPDDVVKDLNSRYKQERL